MEIIKNTNSTGRKLSRDLVQEFHNHFEGFDYSRINPVQISSGIDSSVRFVGSHISVLKPQIINNNIPEYGVHISQNSIRTRNLKIMHDTEKTLNWGSYFCNFGALVNSNNLEKICQNAFDFFEERLNYDPKDIRVRVSAKDSDLLHQCTQRYTGETIEIDTNPPNYYQHSYGLDNIVGRNFNIALRNKFNGEFKDVGNIVIIENEKNFIGIELGLGDSTILQQLYDLNHVLDIYSIPNLQDIIFNEKQKIKDCIIVSTVLSREGLKSSGSRGANQSFRKYLHALGTLSVKNNIPLELLEETINSFEIRQFDEKTGVSETIIERIKQLI